MSTRTLLNLVLLVVISLLALLVVYEPGIEEPPPPVSLTTVTPAAVSRLRVERPNQATVEMEKVDSGWRVVQPFTLSADDFRANSLLEILRSTSHGQLKADDPGLARFSLAPPKASLHLDGTRIDFGDVEPLNGRRYVRLGDTIHLITDRFFHHLLASPADFVDYRLLGPDPKLVEIILPDLHLLRRNGTWSLDPEDPAVSANALAKLVEAWRQTRAIDVRTLEDANSKRAIVVRLEEPAQSVRFLLSETEDEIILARPNANVQYHLARSHAEALLGLADPGPSGHTTGDGPTDRAKIDAPGPPEELP